MKAIEAMRKVVAALPDTSEGRHFQSVAFFVRKRMFATYNEKEGAIVQLEPEHASTLIDQDPRFKRYTRAKHCVSFDPAEVKDFAALVRESYDLIDKKPAPKKKTRKK